MINCRTQNEEIHFCKNIQFFIHFFVFSQELVTSHEISNVCCVVRDNIHPNTFGYVTATESGQSKNTAHVFTTDSQVSKESPQNNNFVRGYASKGLMLCCFSAMLNQCFRVLILQLTKFVSRGWA